MKLDVAENNNDIEWMKHFRSCFIECSLEATAKLKKRLGLCWLLGDELQDTRVIFFCVSSQVFFPVFFFFFSRSVWSKARYAEVTATIFQDTEEGMLLQMLFAAGL